MTKDKKFPDKFYPLTPQSNLEGKDVYSEALEFAITSENIANVALSGPYGSGKSSILQSYEITKKKWDFVHVSLANFKEINKHKENNKGVGESHPTDTNTQEDNNLIQTCDIHLIEKSILQQLKYCLQSDPKNDDKSFRIEIKNPILSAIFITLLIAIFYFPKALIGKDWWESIAKLEFLSSWLPWIIFIPPILIVWVSLCRFICFLKENLNKMPIKKVAIGDAGIEIEEKLPTESVLNQHIEEIIQLFRQNKQHIVVFEDLDRFNTPQIFIKLREINYLINSDKEVCNKVKFIYEIRDDLFCEKERTKFFDFIIPVIPVVNFSNAREKINELVSDHHSDKIDSRFIKEISYFLDDMRLISNIFNEFVVYCNKIPRQNLDLTKLLAFIIYKNIFSRDFANLHLRKGALYRLVEAKTNLIEAQSKELITRKEELNKQLEDADKESFNNIQELVDLYLFHIENVPEGTTTINGKRINEWRDTEQFELLIREQITRSDTHGYSRKISIQDIENEINPDTTFHERKQRIINKSHEKKTAFYKELKTIVKDLVDLSKKPLHKVLQTNETYINKIFDEEFISQDHRACFRYLLFYGYIDDSYPYYISHFYEGRLTRNDYAYLTAIRSFHALPFDYEIHTPQEVCDEMRKEDFSTRYAQNINLVDWLLKEDKEEVSAILDYNADFFNNENTQKFLEIYVNKGQELTAFLERIFLDHSELLVSVCENNYEYLLIALLNHVDWRIINDKLSGDGLITKYLNTHSKILLEINISEGGEAFLKKMGVKLFSLSPIETNKVLVDYFYKENLYQINMDNILFLMQFIVPSLSLEEIKEKNYTSLHKPEFENLLSYVMATIKVYLDKVFLALENNTREDGKWLLELFTLLDDDFSLIEKIITHEEYVFSSFKEIPDEVWDWILKQNKVKATWFNVMAFYGSIIQDSDAEEEKKSLNSFSILNDFLEKNVETLSRIPLSLKEFKDVEEKFESFSLFILKNKTWNTDVYESYIKILYYCYSSFGNIKDVDRQTILIKNKCVQLTEDSFNQCQENDEILSFLIGYNFDIYKKDKDSYIIDDSIREKLFSLDNLSRKDKQFLTHDVTLSGVQNSEALAEIMLEILAEDSFDIKEINDDVLIAVLKAETGWEEARVQLLNRCISRLDKGTVFGILSNWKDPYCRISEYGKFPRLSKTEYNKNLAKNLQDFGYISSYKEKNGTIKINTKRNP